jgi:uncharacterized RDD family membrane protein YckC
MNADTHSPWAGFWRRVGAIFIDFILVGIVGAVIGAVAFDALVNLGIGARLIGLAIAMAYFGGLGSRLGGGQTLGKRLFGIRVCAVDGGGLPLGRALGRSLVLSLPIIVNGVALSSSDGFLGIVVVTLVATLLFGLGLSQLYLLLFNRPGRRLVHDVLFGSVVVRAGERADEAPVAPVHKYVAAGIVLLALVIFTGAAVYASRTSTSSIANLRSALFAVEALPEVQSATIGDNTTTFYSSSGGRSTSHARVIRVRIDSWPKDPEAQAVRISNAANKASPTPDRWPTEVVLNYGYHMGIASGSRSYRTTLQPRASSTQSGRGP